MHTPFPYTTLFRSHRFLSCRLRHALGVEPQARLHQQHDQEEQGRCGHHQLGGGRSVVASPAGRHYSVGIDSALPVTLVTMMKVTASASAASPAVMITVSMVIPRSYSRASFSHEPRIEA